MRLADIIAIIQTIIAVGAFMFAYAEFGRWRKELLGSKKIDLAIRLGKSAIEVREAFHTARFFKSFTDGSTESEYTYRLNIIREKLLPLYELRWEIEVLFGKSIQEEIKQYNTKYHELENAMYDVLQHHQENDAISAILYRNEAGPDSFGKEIEAITDSLFNFARKYIK